MDEVFKTTFLALKFPLNYIQFHTPNTIIHNFHFKTTEGKKHLNYEITLNCKFQGIMWFTNKRQSHM